MKALNPLYNTSTAILAGALIVAIAVLMHGGIIKIGKKTAKSPQAVAAAPQAPSQPSNLPKTEADIVAKLKSYASKLSLNQSQFDTCLDSGSKSQLVSRDLNEGSEAGVNGTPAFFINGRLLSGAQPLEAFKKIIDEELSSPPASVTRQNVSVGDLPFVGNTNAKVTIVEFSDYQCPFCERFYTQTEGQLKKEYINSGKAKFYYRDFPLTQIHPGAQKGAEAARCAGDQGKYWQYHDLIFENQSDIF